MREAFRRELEGLDQEIVSMGALVEQSVQQVTTALIEADTELARRVCAGDQAIDVILTDVERRSLALLAQQAPVARDLRLVVAILRVAADLERAGDLAYNIGRIVQIEDFRDPSLKGVRVMVSELGWAVSELVGQAVDAWANKDEELAADIALQDDQIDELHARLIGTLVELKGQASLGPALRLALVGRYFERIGDHAVNLGERVRYYLTGDGVPQT